MLRIFHGIAVTILDLSMFTKIVAGLLIHMFTTYVAYQLNGTLAAVITFVLPPFSELYWAIAIFAATGMFFNIITILILAYAAIWIAIILAAAIAAASEP